MGAREQQELEVRLEAMALLAGGVAHDFKNFLTVALGYIEMASAEAACPEKVTLYCDKALTALQRSTRLMQQMLAFTRVAAPAKQPLDFTRILKNTVLIAIGESKITAEFTFDARVAALEADERQIAQAITIIVANAIQAMAGSGRLAVKTAVQTFAPGEHFALAPGDYCVVSFTDSGEGIAPDALPHLFEPFFTTWPERSGLGLPTAYAIMKGHQGFIEARPNPDAGATVTLYLPVRAVPA